MSVMADDKILDGSFSKEFDFRLGTTNDGYDDGNNSSVVGANILGHEISINNRYKVTTRLPSETRKR